MDLKTYIKDFNTTLYLKRANLSFDKITRLKTEKWKQDYIHELYACYLQLIENFMIFILVIWSWDILYLFEESCDIRKKFWNYDKNNDLDYLNAFKHGFRIYSQIWPWSVNISPNWGNIAYKIVDSEYSISYLSKKKSMIYQNNIYFDPKYTYTKILFICNTIDILKLFIDDETKLPNTNIGRLKTCIGTIDNVMKTSK